METGLVSIELHASVLGEEFTIAKYCSPVVPQKGEMILLKLHPGYYAIPPSEQRNAHSGTFLVHNVMHVVFNLEQTEPWFEPWPAHKVSDYVVIDVVAEDDNAREYLQGLAGREHHQG